MFYVCRMPGRTKWFKRKIQLEIELRVMLLTMRETKASGDVLAYSYRRMPQSVNEMLELLNCATGLKLIRGWAHIDGEIVNRYSANSSVNLKNAWFFPELHPSKRHASWIYFIDNNLDARELVARAPDARSLHIAFKLAGITTDMDGLGLTADIARYVWNYTHGHVFDRD